MPGSTEIKRLTSVYLVLSPTYTIYIFQLTKVVHFMTTVVIFDYLLAHDYNQDLNC